MASLGKVVITYQVTNPKAVHSLAEAMQRIEAITEEQPWNEDAKEAKKLLKRAVRGLVARTRKEGK